LAQKLAEAIPDSPTARAGIEIALLDTVSKSVGMPLHRYLGGRAITIETSTTVPLIEPRHAAGFARRAAKQGFTTIKIKVGGLDRDQDLQRVFSVAGAAPRAALILDANGAFQPDEALGFIKEVTGRGANVEVFEQPVGGNDLEGLKFVTERSPVPVYADESACTPEDAFRLAKAEAVSGVVVKLMKSGPLGALAISSIAKAASLRLMMGTMLESRVGQSASLHIAASAGKFTWYDLDSDVLLAEQPVRGGFERSGSVVTLGQGTGLGVQVSLQ